MAASDKTLGALHAAVATALTEVIQGTEVEGVRVPAPAPYFGAAIAFLKNNNITADVTTNDELSALQKALADKRHKRGGGDAAALAAAEAFAERNMDIMQ